MNNYNDFPELTNEQYQFMQNEFNPKNTEHKLIAENIYCMLDFSIQSFAILKDTNPMINQEIKNTTTKLIDMQNNISLIYPKSKNNSTQSCDNLFAILSKLIECSEQINTLEQKENKIYNKHLLNKTNIKLLNCIKSILQAVASSEFKLFKFM